MGCHNRTRRRQVPRYSDFHRFAHSDPYAYRNADSHIYPHLHAVADADSHTITH